MRLWHYKLLPYLPQSQLIAQKREIDLMWKDVAQGKKTKHILINYAWQYPLNDLFSYYELLKEEFDYRHIKFNSSKYLIETGEKIEAPFSNHQNERYLLQCFYNLQEKYDRGQKDFFEKNYEELYDFVNLGIDKRLK